MVPRQFCPNTKYMTCEKLRGWENGVKDVKLPLGMFLKHNIYGKMDLTQKRLFKFTGRYFKQRKMYGAKQKFYLCRANIV